MPVLRPKSYDPYAKCGTLAQCPPDELIVVWFGTHFRDADIASSIAKCAYDCGKQRSTDSRAAPVI